MAGVGGRSRVRQALPVVLSFLAVAVLAAGLGYGLGLFLTGALGGDGSPAGDPEPPSTPASSDAEPVNPGSDLPDAAAPGEGADEDPPGAGAGEPGPGDRGDDDGDAAAGGEDGGVDDEDDPVDDGDAAGDGTGGGGDAGVAVHAPPVTVYVVQAGVFSSLEGAEAVLADLRAAGFDGVIAEGDGYRVWTGLFSDREHGRALAAAIAEAGLESFLTEHAVGGSGRLPGGDDEAAAVLRTHLEALPERIRRLAVAVESGEGVAGLAAELHAAERELDSLTPAPEREAIHQSLLRLHATVRGLLEQAGGGAGAAAHPALLAGAAGAAAEAAAIFGGLFP